MALDLSWQQQLYYPPSASLIGSGSKGRRKGSKNRSFVQRLEERDEKNEVKRRNERQRVKNISFQYNRLRRALGDPYPEKKLRKQQVLDACIDYIQQLQAILKNTDSSSSSSECSNSPNANTITSATVTVANEQDGSICDDFKLHCNESFNDTSSSPPTADQSLEPCTFLPAPSTPHTNTGTTLYPPAAYYNYHHPTPFFYTAASPDIDPTGSIVTPALPAATGYHQPSSFFESWNIGGDVELSQYDDYPFANTTPPKSAHQQRQQSSYASFPPPPLHHMY